MQKRLVNKVCMLLVVALMLSFSALAFTTPEERGDTKITEPVLKLSDTTSLTPEEYQAAFQRASELSTDSAIQNMCELFVTSIFASQRDEDYDCIAMTGTSALDTPLDGTLAYLNSWNEYKREVRKLSDYRVVGDQIDFSDFSATVNGDTCTAEIAAHYSFDIEGSFNETCYLNCVYYLTLQKVNNKWTVVSVKSNQANELDDGFQYGSFDARAAAVMVVEDHDFAVVEKPQREVESGDLPGSEDPNVYVPFRKTEYSTYAAIKYAKTYFNKTNSVFGASDANCQNFASQCVWEGLRADCGGSSTSRTAIPAVSTALVGSNVRNVWCRNQYSTFYNSYYLNWGWDNVNGFMKIIWRSDYTQAGPQGYYWLGLAKASAGDVIMYDKQGSRNVDSGDYDHAMFVTQVTGTYGSRGVSNMFIAANTNPTNSAYEPLAEYSSCSASCYATAHIVDGYYQVAEIEYPPTQ